MKWSSLHPSPSGWSNRPSPLVIKSTNGLGWWFGARWFGILGIPLSNNPFHKGILGIQTTNPNHQLTISWQDPDNAFKKTCLPSKIWVSIRNRIHCATASIIFEMIFYIGKQKASGSIEGWRSSRDPKSPNGGGLVREMGPLISGKSRLVEYYNLARMNLPFLDGLFYKHLWP